MRRRETCGVREPSGNAPAIAGGTARRCWYHRNGIPVESMGKPFFKAGCPECEVKAVKDPALRMAPSPDDLRKARAMGRRCRDLSPQEFAELVKRQAA